MPTKKLELIDPKTPRRTIGFDSCSIVETKEERVTKVKGSQYQPTDENGKPLLDKDGNWVIAHRDRDMTYRVRDQSVLLRFACGQESSSVDLNDISADDREALVAILQRAHEQALRSQ